MNESRLIIRELVRLDAVNKVNILARWIKPSFDLVSVKRD